MAGIRRILAVAEPRAALATLERVLTMLTPEVDAVAVVGNLTEAWSTPDTYGATFRMLGRSNVPAFWVPGRYDAPLRMYLSESYNMEIVYPPLHGVHGTMALGPGNVLFAGMGGEILDPPDTMRVEEYLVRYPAWEVEYRLKAIGEIDARARVLLFATPPAHKGRGRPGSQLLAELVKTYDPAVVIVGGEEPEQRLLGKSLVVAPGRLDRGYYAIVDVHDRSVEPRQLERETDELQAARG